MDPLSREFPRVDTLTTGTRSSWNRQGANISLQETPAIKEKITGEWWGVTSAKKECLKKRARDSRGA